MLAATRPIAAVVVSISTLTCTPVLAEGLSPGEADRAVKAVRSTAGFEAAVAHLDRDHDRIVAGDRHPHRDPGAAVQGGGARPSLHGHAERSRPRGRGDGRRG